VILLCRVEDEVSVRKAATLLGRGLVSSVSVNCDVGRWANSKLSVYSAQYDIQPMDILLRWYFVLRILQATVVFD
jgi:hypothetical protein